MRLDVQTAQDTPCDIPGSLSLQSPAVEADSMKEGLAMRKHHQPHNPQSTVSVSKPKEVTMSTTDGT